MQNDQPINPIKMTAPGEWFVSTIDEQIVVVQHNEFGSTVKTIAVFGDEDAHNADEHIANAAMLAVSKNMLDVLVDIQTALMTSKSPIDLEELNDKISGVFAKLANEAGEEL